MGIGEKRTNTTSCVSDRRLRRIHDHRQGEFQVFFELNLLCISLAYKILPRNSLTDLFGLAVKRKNPSSQYIVFPQVIHNMFH
jgi:hypothetical protein